jgi:signal transduction histidine kinase
MSRMTRPNHIPLAAFALAFFAASWISMRIADQTSGVAAIWLTNALMVAALLKTPTSRWTTIAAVGFLANLLADLGLGRSAATGIVFSLSDVIEVGLIALPMRRLRLDHDFRSLHAQIGFMALAFGPAILVSASISGVYMNLTQGRSFLDAASSWYLADGLGMILVAPAAMLMTRVDAMSVFTPTKLLRAASSAFVLAIVFVIMSAWPQLPLGFLLFPCILVLAFQQSYAGVAAGLIVITMIVIANLFLGHGYLASAPISIRAKVFFLQFFIIVLTTTMLTITAVLYEKKKAEQRLRQATQSAIAARNEALQARMEADKANRTKSQFLANMSHELRTPLNAILGFSEIIRDGGLATKCTGKCSEHADHIHSAGHHLLDLVNDVLDTSKIEAGKYELHLERIDLSNAVRDATALVEHRAAESGLTLTIDDPSNTLWLLADYRAVKQIALNLISNAVKFTPPGGSITIAVRTTDKGAEIVVRDTGIGIPANELPRLGRPFERVRNHAAHAQPGTGLGLALVRSLAELHGGRMEIESTEAVGTTVSVTFPVDADSLAA